MRLVIPLVLFGAGSLCGAEPTHRYEGDVPMTEANPVWNESRKGGGGKAVLTDGKLCVEVEPGKSHFYVIGKSGDSERGSGSDAYDGAATAGTTVDFSVAVRADDPEHDAFGIQVGTGIGSASIIFRTGAIVIGKRIVERDNTKAGVFRIAFRDGQLSLFSADGGELFSNVPITPKYPVNVISMGTRPSMQFGAPVSWELDFIRWSNAGAIFSAPKL